MRFLFAPALFSYLRGSGNLSFRKGSVSSGIGDLAAVIVQGIVRSSEAPKPSRCIFNCMNTLLKANETKVGSREVGKEFGMLKVLSREGLRCKTQVIWCF